MNLLTNLTMWERERLVSVLQLIGRAHKEGRNEVAIALRSNTKGAIVGRLRMAGFQVELIPELQRVVANLSYNVIVRWPAIPQPAKDFIQDQESNDPTDQPTVEATTLRALPAPKGKRSR